MPASNREIPLCRYHYDPLDRQVDWTPFEQAAIQRYYCNDRLSAEIQGTVQRTIVQHEEQLLAQQQHEGGKVAATLLATDLQRSVLNALDANQPHHFAYTPYGYRPMENGLLSLLGFNGERPDPITGNYHLGNGYRQFNPALMRFNNPDSWSPFGEGGLNAYVYCGGDPRNRYDPNGHKFGGFFRAIGRRLKLRESSKIKAGEIALEQHDKFQTAGFFKERLHPAFENNKLINIKTHISSDNNLYLQRTYQTDQLKYTTVQRIATKNGKPIGAYDEYLGKVATHENSSKDARRFVINFNYKLEKTGRSLSNDQVQKIGFEQPAKHIREGTTPFDLRFN